MGYLQKFRIGTRLGLGFAIVLLLFVATALYAINSGRSTAADTKSMMEIPLAKERIASDWYSVIHSAVVRTSFIAKSTDTTLATSFDEEIKQSVITGTGLSKKLEPLLVTEKEKASYAKLLDLRKIYQAAKESTMKAKTAGDGALADKEFKRSFLPAAAAYERQVLDFLQMQRDEIDRLSKEIAETNRSTLNAMVTLTIVAVSLGALIAFMIAKSVTAPIREATSETSRIAAGDLRGRTEVTGQDEMADLLRSLQKMKHSLSTLIERVQVGASAIASASTEIATGNLDLSSRTEQQAGSLEETVATMEELTSTVKQNAENTHLANNMASAATKIAADGAAIVSTVIQRMTDLEQSSTKMADIIAVIDGIAFQTNILALNAAVEAARAGEQGRGFAVVATEVRNLAQRSAAAAKEIKSLISTSVAQVRDCNGLVESAGSNMSSIVQSIKKVTDVMGEIAAASNEQRSGIEQINQAMTEMDGVTQQNAALVEQAAAAAESLQNQAAAMAQAVSVFTIDGAAQIPQRPMVHTSVKQSTPAPHRAKYQAIGSKITTSRPAAPARSVIGSSPKRAADLSSNGGDWDEF